MKKQTKIMIGILAVFVVAVTMSVAFAEPASAKTFKSQEGYTWEIKDSEWINMKRMAEAEYDNAVNQGRAMCRGFSNSHDVTVTKDGVKYDLMAFAVKNDHSMRCEVRGLSSGYLTDYEHV